MSETIAGHEFDSLDRCKTCVRTWFQIMHVERAQIGSEGIAHYGALNEAEYLSIDRRRIRDKAWIWDVTIGLATGNGVPVASEREVAEAA